MDVLQAKHREARPETEFRLDSYAVPHPKPPPLEITEDTMMEVIDGNYQVITLFSPW